MTGTELLALLTAHPKACKMLDLSFRDTNPEAEGVFVEVEYNSACGFSSIPESAYDDDRRDAFETWLLGATTAWCDEHWIDVIQSNGRYIASTGCDEHYQEFSSKETRLAANLAAMEAHTP